jgi:hypothetical protein
MPTLFPPLRATSGFGGRPLKSASGAFLVRQTSLTTAQLQSAQATAAGFTLVPAPGALKVIVPFWWSYSEKRLNAFTSTPTFRCRYAGATTTPYTGLSTIGMMAGGTANANFTTGILMPANASSPALTIPPGTSITGLALNLTLNAALTGAGSHDGPVVFTVGYIIMPIPF